MQQQNDYRTSHKCPTCKELLFCYPDSGELSDNLYLDFECDNCGFIIRADRYYDLYNSDGSVKSNEHSVT